MVRSVRMRRTRALRWKDGSGPRQRTMPLRRCPVVPQTDSHRRGHSLPLPSLQGGLQAVPPELDAGCRRWADTTDAIAREYGSLDELRLAVAGAPRRQMTLLVASDAGVAASLPG